MGWKIFPLYLHGKCQIFNHQTPVLLKTFKILKFLVQPKKKKKKTFLIKSIKRDRLFLLLKFFSFETTNMLETVQQTLYVVFFFFLFPTSIIPEPLFFSFTKTLAWGTEMRVAFLCPISCAELPSAPRSAPCALSSPLPGCGCKAEADQILDTANGCLASPHCLLCSPLISH